MTSDPSERETQILDFIAEFVAERGFPPTVREIGEGLGLSSPGTVHAYLTNLVDAGYIERVPGSPRAIRLLT